MSKNGHDRKLARKKRLFKRQGGKCFWCKRPVHLNSSKGGGRLDDDLGTLDHLDDRLSETRGKRQGEERTVLSCYKCNHERGSASVLLNIDRARAKSVNLKILNKKFTPMKEF